MNYPLFSVPAGSVIDTCDGKMRVTQPDGCVYLLRNIKARPELTMASFSQSIEDQLERLGL